MTIAIKTTHRALVALILPKVTAALILYAINIVKRMTANAYFPSPVPLLATITAAIADLQAAEAAALSRIKGAVSVRNEKRKALVMLLQQLRGYIQSIADADEANGPAIIESAGVALRKKATRPARVFAAKPGRTSGVATVLASSAGPRASYEWQYSADGGKTWVTAPATLQSKTSIAGLAPGATVQFKYRPVTRLGEGDWSQPVSLLIQ